MSAHHHVYNSKNAWLYAIDPVRNLLYVKGQVPGHKGNFVLVRDAIKGISFEKPYLITAKPKTAAEMLSMDFSDVISKHSNKIGGGALMVADVGEINPFLS